MNRRSVNIALGIIVCLSTFAVVRYGVVPHPTVQLRWGPVWERPSGPPITDRQLALIYIGSSTCGAARRPEVARAVRTAVEHLSREALRLEIDFGALGVARDYDLQSGIEHLEAFGVFDELLVGNGQYNTGVLRWVYQKVPGNASTPQIVLILREVSHFPSVGVHNPTVLARIVGVEELLEWTNRGCPIPRLAAQGTQ